MSPINQCIVALALTGYAFWIVDAQATSAEGARKICERSIKTYDVYKDQTVDAALIDCMYEHLGK